VSESSGSGRAFGPREPPSKEQRRVQKVVERELKKLGVDVENRTQILGSSDRHVRVAFVVNPAGQPIDPAAIWEGEGAVVVVMLSELDQGVPVKHADQQFIAGISVWNRHRPGPLMRLVDHATSVLEYEGPETASTAPDGRTIVVSESPAKYDWYLHSAAAENEYMAVRRAFRKLIPEGAEIRFEVGRQPIELRQTDSEYEQSGCIAGFTGWVLAGTVAALIAFILLALLLVGVFSDDGGTDDADPPAATAGTDVGGSGQVGAVPLDEYADGVCEILAGEVQTGSGAFGAALDASRGAQPATAEEFAQLYADLETGARELAAGLTAAADRLDASRPPDVEGGTEANEGAAATYREAADTATAIADTVAGFDAANATPAETEAFAADVNVLIQELGVLGTEFESNPEIAEAVRQSQVCAEAEAAATGD